MHTKIFWVLLFLIFLLLLVKCNKLTKDSELIFKDVVESVNEIFDIEIPSEVSEITVFKEGWQASGVYTYFEIPSQYLTNIKKVDVLWQEIPEEYRNLPSSVVTIRRDDFKHERLCHTLLRIENYFEITKSYYKLHNNPSDKIQWYYYDEKGGEKIIQMMISEPEDGICRCYFSDGDMTYTDKGQKLYQYVKSEKTITFYKNK